MVNLINISFKDNCSYRDTDPRIVAKLFNATCHLPKSNELFIDIDDEKDLITLGTNLQLINDKLKWQLKITTFRPSATQGHFHVIIALIGKTFSNIERIALQTILGSDRKKEAYGFIHTTQGFFPPTALFTYGDKEILF